MYIFAAFKTNEGYVLSGSVGQIQPRDLVIWDRGGLGPEGSKVDQKIAERAKGERGGQRGQVGPEGASGSQWRKDRGK